MADEIRLSLLADLQNIPSGTSDTILWLRDASNPYWDWLWGSTNEALAQIRQWLDRPSSEISMDRLVCMTDGHRILGGFVALTGLELQRCRRADFLALLNYARRNHCDELLERIRQANQIFSNVLGDEYYLSRIGVQACTRGKGLGKQLMKAYMDRGIASGFRRFRLDVARENVQAIQLYQASGFTIVSAADTLEAPIRYCSMTATV